MKEPFIILKTFVTIEKWTFTPPNDFLSTELTKQALFSVWNKSSYIKTSLKRVI